MYSWLRLSPTLWAWTYHLLHGNFSSMRSHSSIAGLHSWANAVKSFLCLHLKEYCVLFILTISIYFLLRSLIYLELIFVRGDRDRSNLILLHMDIQFPQPHLLKMLCFLERVVLVFVQISNGWSHVVSWFDIVLFHVYFCSSTVLFLTLRFCDRFWNLMVIPPNLLFLLRRSVYS